MGDQLSVLLDKRSSVEAPPIWLSYHASANASVALNTYEDAPQLKRWVDHSQLMYQYSDPFQRHLSVIPARGPLMKGRVPGRDELQDSKPNEWQEQAEASIISCAH